jgi:WD40 repeat protein
LNQRREEVRFAIESPRGARVLTVGGNGAALWNPAHPAEPELLFKPHGSVTAAAFSPDGKYVATGGTDRRIKIWNAETALAVAQLPGEHAAAITSASYSPRDGRLLLTASADGSARLWDVAARRVLHVLAHQEQPAAAKAVRAAVFSPDGASALTAGDDAALRIWDTVTGKPLASFQAESPVHCAAFSPDGRFILAGLQNGQAVIFDAQSHRPLVRFAGHTDVVSSVAFSPDGRRALSGSRDRLVKIWDADWAASSTAGEANQAAPDPAAPKAGKELLTLRYHDQAVTSVAFSPDGRSIVSASLDGTAVLWPTADVPPQTAAK